MLRSGESKEMTEKLKIIKPIIVEGKYDKIRLLSVVDADVITTDGFGIFNSDEKDKMIRRIAEKNGIIVLTDSDGGGLVIRNHFASILPKDKVSHVYIPEIKGKEKRKPKASKEGLLGVEGIDCEKLRDVLEPFSEKNAESVKSGKKITKTNLFSDGISGGTGSAEKRKKLCAKAGLPTNISSNAMLDALNMLYTYDEYKELIKDIQ